jgi:hypothetical protein
MTRRPEEKNCQTCIQSVYLSRRVSVIVWGALGWDFKSSLIFLTKEEGRHSICSTVYVKQVLEKVGFPYYNLLDEDKKEEFIFIGDRSKVYKGKARLPKLEKGIREFD